MQSNKVEYSTAAGRYYTVYDVNVPFCMPEFSSSKIIHHRFHVGSGNGELCIGYDMIIGHVLTVQLDLVAEFKRHVLQGYGTTVTM